MKMAGNKASNKIIARSVCASIFASVITFILLEMLVMNFEMRVIEKADSQAVLLEQNSFEIDNHNHEHDQDTAGEYHDNSQPKILLPWIYPKIDESQLNSIESPANQIPQPLNISQKLEMSLKDQKKNTSMYGGFKVDQVHLGGFIINDSKSYEPQLWEWVIETFNISSVMDIGCGLGYSTSFFVHHNKISNVLCIEGSIDAIKNSIVPNNTIQHDYSLGPYWPSGKNSIYDMVWCVEFLEHIDKKYIANYMATFKKAKYLFVSHSVLGGYHHVNIQNDAYWIDLFQSYGFIHSSLLTEKARDQCPMDPKELKYTYPKEHLKQSGYRRGSYFHYTGLVFMNQLLQGQMTEFDRLLLEMQQQGNMEKEKEKVW